MNFLKLKSAFPNAVTSKTTCKMYKEECKELCKLHIVETEGTIRTNN